jgi:hypothetical protein
MASTAYISAMSNHAAATTKKTLARMSMDLDGPSNPEVLEDEEEDGG